MVEMHKHLLDFLEISRLRRLLGAIFADQREQPDIHKVFMDMTGGTHATAVMLASVVQWDARMRDHRDGWWYKSDSSWLREVGLSRHDARKGRELMVAAGVESEKRTGPDGREIWYYRVNPDTFWLRLAATVRLCFEQIYDMVERLVYSEKFAGTMRKIHMDPVKNSHGHSEKSTPSMRKTDNVYHPVLQPNLSSGDLSGMPAVVSAGARGGEENPTTDGDPDNPREKLQIDENTRGGPSGAPPAPPPVPPDPLPTAEALAIVQAHPLWLAFAGEWIEPPVIPETLSSDYLEVLQRLVAMNALAGEVQSLTRRKLAEKRHLRARGIETADYRWKYLPEDLPEERERSGGDGHTAWVRKFEQSPYAQYYANASHFLPVGT